MSEWPQESRERAENLLSRSMTFLYNELYLFVESLTPDFTYTEALSRINHRIGETGIFAEIAGNEYVQTLMNELTEELSILLMRVNFDEAHKHLKMKVYLIEEECTRLLNKERDRTMSVIMTHTLKGIRGDSESKIL
jgi:hypothetical protein